MATQQEVAALRRRLEAAYGLTLSSIPGDQLGRAAELAASEELTKIADHLPISESSLMRDPEMWSWLEEHHLPEALGRAAQTHLPLRALSLGCSDGQEVFSLAITVLGVLRRLGIPGARAFELLEARGIDISEARIARARSGLLADWSVRGAPRGEAAAQLSRVPGGWQISSQVAALCRFDRGNLLTLSAEQVASFDLLLCRHVLIYFDPERAAAVLESIAAAMRPGALLVVAPVEAHLLPASLVDRLGPVGVARRARPATAPAPVPVTARAALPVCAEPSASEDARTSASAAEEHRARALCAAEQGRLHEAVTLARAATFLQPGHLGGRFLLARLQFQLQPELGRRLLEAVRDEALRHSDTDPDLSNHQLALAASALLATTPER